jgi:hypothetical protein
MRPLRNIISAEAALAGLLDRRLRELALLDLLRKTLPPALAAQTGVASASPPELVLSAASGAAATLLRHRGPELVETLSREGWKFTGIRIRVQARHNRADRSKVHAKQIDEKSAAALRAGADRLADPNLAAALRRLADSARADSADEHEPFEGVEHKHPEQQK